MPFIKWSKTFFIRMRCKDIVEKRLFCLVLQIKAVKKIFLKNKEILFIFFLVLLKLV